VQLLCNFPQGVFSFSQNGDFVALAFGKVRELFSRACIFFIPSLYQVFYFICGFGNLIQYCLPSHIATGVHAYGQRSGI
jgi:hypothetical protein